mgnify:CR=1 FL=1
MIRRPFDRPGARIGHIRIIPQAAQHAHCQVTSQLDLAGKAGVRRTILQPGQPRLFGRCHRPGITCQDLNPAGCATRVTPTPVKDITPRILDAEDQPPPFAANGLTHAFDRDLRHWPTYSFPSLANHEPPTPGGHPESHSLVAPPVVPDTRRQHPGATSMDTTFAHRSAQHQCDTQAPGNARRYEKRAPCTEPLRLKTRSAGGA